jgi:transposase
MDNAVIQKSKIIRETIENDNNHLLYLVPYHPETNSIEEFFSQLKHYITPFLIQNARITGVNE